MTNATFYMWYCAGPGKDELWNTGLATASHPLGPWTRWEFEDGHLGGPVMDLHGGAPFVGGRRMTESSVIFVTVSQKRPWHMTGT